MRCCLRQLLSGLAACFQTVGLSFVVGRPFLFVAGCGWGRCWFLLPPVVWVKPYINKLPINRHKAAATRTHNPFSPPPCIEDPKMAPKICTNLQKNTKNPKFHFGFLEKVQIWAENSTHYPFSPPACREDPKIGIGRKLGKS